MDQLTSQAMAGAEVVIARSGYSTIMDLCFLGKKAILIPTPGQTEQEYLGRRLQEQGMAVMSSQNELDLPGAVAAVRSINGFPVMSGNDLMKTVLEDFVRKYL